MPHKSLIRGSTDLHLDEKGRLNTRKLADQFKRLGAIWRVYSSTQARALETAHLLAVGQPDATMMAPMGDIESWHLGGYEGQEKDTVIKKIQDLVENRPWAVPQGMGKASTQPGECFLCFRERVIAAFRQLIELAEENPTKRIIVVTHFHDIRLLLAWLAKYNNEPPPDGLGYDHKVYNVDTGEPLDVYHLYKKGTKIYMDKMDIEKAKDLPFQLFVIRHASTNWN